MKRYLILICILINGCNQQPESISINCIDFCSNPDSVISKLSEIATNIEYIPLQVKGSGINAVRISDDRYFIKNYSDEIECLDKNGRYLYKLSKKGNAAGEYISLQNYDVTSDGKLLAISSYSAINLYENDGTDFNFIKKTNLNNNTVIPNIISFVPGGTGLLLSYFNMGTIPFVDILFNPSGDTLAVRPNKNRTRKTLKDDIFLRGIHYIYNNAVYFKESFNDTLYTLNKSYNIIPYLVFSTHEQRFTPKIVARIQSGRSKSKFSDYFNIISLMETSRYIIGLVIYRRTEFIRVYDKIINKYYSLGNGSLLIKDNIAGGPDFMPVYCDGRKLYRWVPAQKLKDYISGKDFLNSEAIPEKKKNLKILADGLQNTDSHILIVVTPKE